MAAEATKIPFVEGSAPSTPSANRVVMYAKSDGLMYSKDDAGAETLMSSGSSGNVATDAIWDAAGDLAVGSGANTAAKLSIGATNGMALQRVSGAVAWTLPAGYEYDYVEFTGGAAPTATSEATANTVVTANAKAFDGSTVVVVEFFAPSARADAGAAGRSMTFVLYDDTGGGAASIGMIGFTRTPAASTANHPVLLRRRLTPSNATHTFSIRAHVSAGTGDITSGTGGSGAFMPGYIRIVKA